jgi:hypothetical protein
VTRSGTLAAVAAIALGAGAASVHAFQDGPPVRSTGGFGEDSCQGCHFGGRANDPAGSLGLTGLPDRFVPGDSYALVVTVEHPDLAVAGFQLTIRDIEAGAQVGTFEVPADERGRVDVTDARDVMFVHHSASGAELDKDGHGRWTIRWTAPQTVGPIVVHAAAVAGDGDASQAGDHVYTLEQSAEPVATSTAGCCVRSSCAGSPSVRRECGRC